MADVIINVEAQLDVKKLLKQFEQLTTDDTAMLEIYNLFAKLIEPWVPMDNGILAHGYEVTPEHLRYPGPYAHYQYRGIVYGPNYPIKEGGEVVGFFTNPYGKKAPIIEGGTIVGWYSPPEKFPDPTGGQNHDGQLTYNKEKHEHASKEWDKAAYPVIKDQFLEGVKQILIRRWKELYADN